MRFYLTLGVLFSLGITAAVAVDPPFSIPSYKVWIEDGDTIDLSFRSEDTRLILYNAPEINGAHCSKERNLGYAAKNRLIQLRNGGNLTFQFEDLTSDGYVPWPSLSNPPKDCQYGRSCGTLYSNGVNVMDILISEGLALPYCDATGCHDIDPYVWCQ